MAASGTEALCQPLSSMTLSHVHELPAAESAVLALAASERHVAIATSAHSVSLLDRTTLKPVAESSWRAHSDRINELCFAPSDTLVSASSDGTVKLWDVSQGKPLAVLASGDANDEVWSVSVQSHLLAAGTESAVVVWDVRHTSTPLARYELHTEAVTQVRFLPSAAGQLLSGSVDGLLCEIDTRQTEEDDAVIGVHNNESPVAGLGFCSVGGSSQRPLAWVLSSTDVVSIWDLEAADRIAMYDQLVRHAAADHLAADELAASSASARAAIGPPVPIDFVIGCEFDVSSERLSVLGGERCGETHLLELPPLASATTSAAHATGDGTAAVQSSASNSAPVRHLLSLPSRSAGGAHADAVRCFHVAPGATALLTAGDDGRVAAWIGAQKATTSTSGPRADLKATRVKDRAPRSKPYDRPGGGARDREA